MTESKGLSVKTGLWIISTVIMLLIAVYLVPLNVRVERNEEAVKKIPVLESKVEQQKCANEEIKDLLKDMNNKMDDLKQEMHQQDIKDAEWKGEVNKTLEKSIFYGHTDQLKNLDKATKEYQETIEKKTVE